MEDGLPSTTALDAQSEPVLRRQLQALLAQLDEEIARHSPQCSSSGRCCRFTEFGHTLFLSRLEADYLLEPGLPLGWVFHPGTCPYQAGNLCTARERRPIGCRVFFCAADYQETQRHITERFVRLLKELHGAYSLPWDYRPLHQFLPMDKGNTRTVSLPIVGEIS